MCHLLLTLLLVAAIAPVSRAKPVPLGGGGGSNASATSAPVVASPVWSWQMTWRTPPIGHRFAAEPLVMDLNSDGADEIVLAGFDGALSVLGAADGRPVGGGGAAWPRFHHGEAHFAAPVRFDVDQDGEEELVFVSYAGGLHFYSQDGELKHEGRLPTFRVPASWLADDAKPATASRLLDTPDIPAASESGGSDSENLRPLVFASPVLCDCDGDGRREEMALGVTYAGDGARLLSALLVYSLRLRRTTLCHWLELGWRESARPPFLFSTPLWGRLSPEHPHNSLVTASASGRLFAHRFDSVAGGPGRLVSLQGFPVAMGVPLLHPPQLVSRVHPGAGQSAGSSPSPMVVAVSDSDGAVTAVDARGQTAWTVQVGRAGHDHGAAGLTSLAQVHRAGSAFLALVEFGAAGGAARLHLVTAATGEARSLELGPGPPLSGAAEGGGHRLVEPLSRLLPLWCRWGGGDGGISGVEAIDALLLAGVDSAGRLAVVSLLGPDAGRAAVSLAQLNATSALGLSGVNSARTGLADLVVLTTEGEVVKLGHRLRDLVTGGQCDLRIQESLSIRILGAPYIEQSGSTLILPIFIDDLLNADGLLSAVYTVQVFVYNQLTLTLRYSQPGPHVMYFDAGDRPLKTELLLRASSSLDGRAAETQATLVANVNYVQELPFLLYLPAGVTLLLMLGHLLTAEDSSHHLLPLAARHME